ncbi:MAG: SIMPL domain-containing protein [Gammaproteobacteria bacterium]
MSHVKQTFRGFSYGVLAALAVAMLPAQAQNNFNLEVLNPGEIMVNLNASEQTEVVQDTLHANLTYSAQGRDRVALQDEVNRIMADVLEVLEEGDVEYSTQQYRVYQIQSGRPTRGDLDNPAWRAQQGVQLTGMDSDAVLDMVAELQELGMTMNGLSYSLSAQRQEEVADSLMDAALAKVRNRADATAAAMGKSSVEIVELTMNSNSNGGYYRAAMSTLAMDSSMEVATPVAEPGMTTVTFNVNARAILLP